MRLIDTETLELKWFPDEHHAPAYGILSHTWGREEITLQQFQSTSPDTSENLDVTRSAGYRKVEAFCGLAKAQGVRYAWVDTVCIDKTGSTELSEAINSMYAWYKKATFCHVFLADSSLQYINALSTAAGSVTQEKDQPCSTSPRLNALFTVMRQSRWFTRGWTLQELLAPAVVHFYDQSWMKIGDLTDLDTVISSITDIPLSLLRRHSAISDFSVAQRFSWAARRTTTVAEDMSYCLLGLFGVNMPLLYGERGNAFQRLQQEILRSSNDQSILAWGRSHLGFYHPRTDLLAPGVNDFRNCQLIRQLRSEHSSTPIEFTNSGVRVSLPVLRVNRSDNYYALLACYSEQAPRRIIGLRIRVRADGEARFRDFSQTSFPLAVYQRKRSATRVLTFKYAASTESVSSRAVARVPLTFSDARVVKEIDFVDGAIRTGFSFTLEKVSPTEEWDMEQVAWDPALSPQPLAQTCCAEFELSVCGPSQDTKLVRIAFASFPESHATFAPLAALLVDGRISPGDGDVVGQDPLKALAQTIAHACERRWWLAQTDVLSLRGEAILPIERGIELQIHYRRYDAMPNITVTARTTRSSVQRLFETCLSRWRLPPKADIVDSQLRISLASDRAGKHGESLLLSPSRKQIVEDIVTGAQRRREWRIRRQRQLLTALGYASTAAIAVIFSPILLMIWLFKAVSKRRARVSTPAVFTEMELATNEA